MKRKEGIMKEFCLPGLLRRLVCRPAARTQREAHYLDAGELIAMSPRRASRLIVTTGIAWVTLEGEGRDRIMRAGDDVVLPAGRRTVIQALDGHAWVECSEQE